MAKVKFTLHKVADEILRAEEELRSIRPDVSKADRKKIDLNLKELKIAYTAVRSLCPKAKKGVRPFGQLFVVVKTPPKKK